MVRYGYASDVLRVVVSHHKHSRPRHRGFTVKVENLEEPQHQAVSSGLTEREADLVSRGAVIGLMAATKATSINWTDEDYWKGQGQ
jgi:hypothetical protein